MAWTGVITNAGDRLLTQWESGGVLHIESAAAGTGTAAEVALLAQTDLVSRRQAAGVLSKEDLPEGLKIKLRITAPDAGYTLNQYGIWARLNDGPSTLLALFQRPDGIPIPSKSEHPDFTYTFYALLAVSNQGKLDLHIDTSVLASMEDLQNTATALKPTILTITLTAVGWDNAAKTQTAVVTGVEADELAQLITPAPALESQQAYMDAGIRCTGQSAGHLTFTCDTVPAADLTVYVVIQPLA